MTNSPFYLSRAPRKRPVLLLIALSLAVLILTAACGTRPPTHLDNVKPPQTAVAPAGIGFDIRDKPRVVSEAEAADYLGNAVCAACHRESAAAHARSSHANTFRPVSLRADAARFRTAQAVTDSHLKYNYHLRVENNRCLLVGSNAHGTGRIPAQYALGSGHNGITYISQTEPDQWVELRLSYFSRAKTWDFTPGQEEGEDLPRAAGRPHPLKVISQCLMCHGTIVRGSAEHIDLDKSLMNVGCERCHGPGRAHVDQAIQARASTPALLAQAKLKGQLYGMEDLKRATPQRITAICGACHLAETPAKPLMPAQVANLARFQGASLQRSACFQRSGTLSCVTCHGGHVNADPNLARNDAICLTCHSQKTTEDGRHPTPDTQLGIGNQKSAIGNVCPINPRAGCTACHMPKQTVPAMPHSQFTNHWIKVWPNTSSPH